MIYEMGTPTPAAPVARGSPRSASRTLVEFAYVVGVAGLMAHGVRDPRHPVLWAVALAGILTLPTIVAMLPFLYLGAALAWNVTGADLGGRLWPMTVLYAGALTTAACGDVALLRVITRR